MTADETLKSRSIFGLNPGKDNLACASTFEQRSIEQYNMHHWFFISAGCYREMYKFHYDAGCARAGTRPRPETPPVQALPGQKRKKTL